MPTINEKTGKAPVGTGHSTKLVNLVARREARPPRSAGLTVAWEVLYSFPIIRRPISSRTGIRHKERNKNV